MKHQKMYMYTTCSFSLRVNLFYIFNVLTRDYSGDSAVSYKQNYRNEFKYCNDFKMYTKSITQVMFPVLFTGALVF